MLQPACKSIQTWGFTDAHSWVPSTFATQGAALEFDANYAAKPAYFAIQQRLAQGRPGSGSTPTATASPSHRHTDGDASPYHDANGYGHDGAHSECAVECDDRSWRDDEFGRLHGRPERRECSPGGLQRQRGACSLGP